MWVVAGMNASSVKSRSCSAIFILISNECRRHCVSWAHFSLPPTSTFTKLHIHRALLPSIFTFTNLYFHQSSLFANLLQNQYDWHRPRGRPHCKGHWAYWGRHRRTWHRRRRWGQPAGSLSHWRLPRPKGYVKQGINGLAQDAEFRRLYRRTQHFRSIPRQPYSQHRDLVESVASCWASQYLWCFDRGCLVDLPNLHRIQGLMCWHLLKAPCRDSQLLAAEDRISLSMVFQMVQSAEVRCGSIQSAWAAPTPFPLLALSACTGFRRRNMLSCVQLQQPHWRRQPFGIR